MAQRMSNDNRGNRDRDYRAELTQQIIALVEEGVAPWQKPWNPNQAANALVLPFNGVSGRPYHGGNTLWLMTRASLEGCDDPRWCTFKQAVDMGWHIRKGSKSTTVEYWQFDKEEKGFNPDTGQVGTRIVKIDPPRVFYAHVFNAKQIEGIPPYEPRTKANWNPVEDAERALSNSGAKILHDQLDRAFYSLSRDAIHLPPRSAFQSSPDYYEIALHELGHWTGHPTRMARDLSGPFGSETYAKEELRAQMASLFLSVELGMPFNPGRHAAYQASWVKVLKDDKHEIFRAARDAENIMQFVLGLAREQDQSLDREQANQEQIAAYGLPHQSFGKEPPAMKMQANVNTAEKPDNGKILYNGEVVDRVRYEVTFDPDKLTPVIQTADLSFLQGRKESAILKGLSRSDVEKLLGPYNLNSLENRVGANKRGNDQTHAKGTLSGQGLTYVEVDTLPPETQPSQNIREDMQGPEPTASLEQVSGEDPAKENQKASEEKAKAFDSELIALKNEHMGKDARLYRARDNTGRSQYDGIIITETGSHIVQKLNERSAIVHEKSNLQRDVEVGNAVSIVYDEGKVFVEELSADHERLHDRRHHEPSPQEPRRDGDIEREKRDSFLFARNIVLKQFGEDTKVYDASKVDADKGKFTGTIVAITDHHVMQRIGANTVISHDRADLAGSFFKGAFVQIQYANGQGLISQTERQQSRTFDRGPAR